MISLNGTTIKRTYDGLFSCALCHKHTPLIILNDDVMKGVCNECNNETQDAKKYDADYEYHNDVITQGMNFPEL